MARYKVKSNENLLGIAQENNLTYEDLLRANPGIRRVSTGQVIKLPPTPPTSLGITGQVGKNAASPVLDVLNKALVGDQENISTFAQLMRSGARSLGFENLPEAVPPGQPLTREQTFRGFAQNVGAGSGEDVFTPTTTAYNPNPQKLADLTAQIGEGIPPPFITTQDAKALGFSSSDMIRAGYITVPGQAQVGFIWAGGDQGTQPEEPQGLGGDVQRALQKGERKKATRLQKYENYLSRQAVSWAKTKNRGGSKWAQRGWKYNDPHIRANFRNAKARGEVSNWAQYEAKLKAQQVQQAQPQSQTLSDVGGYGLVNWTVRRATG